jgi:hypothetical protein
LRINHYVAGETEGQRTGVNEIVKEGKSGGVTFLTAVAGTAVLGVQFAILTPFMARCGEPVGVCSFALDHSNYRFLPLLPWQRPKPSLEVAINRFWLLVSWKFCTIFQPFIGGYTVLGATGTEADGSEETFVKGYRSRSRCHPPPVRFHNCNTTL